MESLEPTRGFVAQTAGRGSRWRLLERLFWAIGLVCLVIWGVLRIDQAADSRHELVRFDALRAETRATAQVATPDMSLWDTERIAAWRSSLEQEAPPPLAVLRIPKIGLEVAVLPGTDDLVLNRAVGHIEGTAVPGEDSNSGIAGHRDGFFRGLKDIGPGDGIEVETLRGKDLYRVERVWIVFPEDVWVLDATPERSITLVTCYPFYFVGSAPQRYIVRAVRTDPTASPEGAQL